MKNWINKNYKTLIIAAFLVPIITVAIVSISHVTTWYGISNPITWSVYLSIGIEIAALSALAAISANMGSKVYFPFAIVTLIQFIGNIFFAYSYINIDSQQFKDWVDLVSPLVEFLGVEPTDLVGHKRFLSFFAGGMLPVISLSFLHMLVKFTEEDRKKQNETINQLKPDTTIEASDLVGEVSRIRLSENDLKKLEEVLLTPPSPNEELIKAAKRHEEKIKQESVISDEEILKKAEEIRHRQILQREEELKNEREEIYIPDEDKEKSTALDNSEYKENIDVELVEEGVVNDKPTSVEEKTLNLRQVVFKPIEEPTLPTKEERAEILSEMMRFDEELGLYDESFDVQIVKESPIPPQNASEMMLTTNSDIIESIPSDDEFTDWDVTLMDGLEDEPPFFTEEEIENIFQEEPTEEEESRNFSIITSNSDNIFQEDPKEQFKILVKEFTEPIPTPTNTDELVEKKNF